MARYVKLTAVNGAAVHVNPNQVVLIMAAVDDKGLPLLGQSVVMFANQAAPPMQVGKAPADVVELLEGGVVVEVANG